MPHLPDELIVSIFGYLSPNEDRSTLAALCMTSKVMLNIARPILYSDLSGVPLSDVALIRTLGEKDAGILGKYVRKAAIEVVLEPPLLLTEEYSASDEQKQERERQGEIRLLQSQIAYNQSLNSLYSCPHLQHLSISTFYEEDPVWIQRRLETTDLPRCQQFLYMPFLHSLTYLSLGEFGFVAGAFDYFTQLILAAPRLHTLALTNIGAMHLFPPMLYYMGKKPDSLLALRTLCYKELLNIEYEVDCTVEECMQYLSRLPFLNTFQYRGPGIDVRNLDEDISGLRRVPMGIENLTMMLASKRRSDQRNRNWWDQLASYFPAVRSLVTDLDIKYSLPVPGAFPKLEHLTINYSVGQVPPFKDIENIFIDNPAILSCVRLNVRGLSDAMVQLWLGEMSDFVCQLSSTGVQTLVCAGGRHQMTWVKVGHAYRLQDG